MEHLGSLESLRLETQPLTDIIIIKCDQVRVQDTGGERRVACYCSPFPVLSSVEVTVGPMIILQLVTTACSDSMVEWDVRH